MSTVEEGSGKLGKSVLTVTLCLLTKSEAIPIKSHQNDYPNMSWERMTLIDVPKYTEKCPQGLIKQGTLGTKGTLRTREIVFIREQHTNDYPISNGQSWKYECKWNYTDWASYSYELYTWHTN